MKKYIIGLGCSWTQGEGGYPDEIVQKYNGRVQQFSRTGNDADSLLWPYERENSWVNVLCRDHFTEYTPMNLGVKGIGNRAAVEQLHFCNRIDWDNATGIIVLMWSGFERLDFIQQFPMADDGTDDCYSDNTYTHYKWRTAWPYECEHDEKPLWSVYGKMLWSEQFVAVGQMLALLDLQIFAKAHNFKLVLANGFNYPNTIGHSELPVRPHEYLKRHTGTLYDKFDWSNYANAETEYVSFIQKLVWEDGLLEKDDWQRWFGFYESRSWPSEYLTNCQGAHPTIKGYKVIAQELANFIRAKGYA
jgi:hypothetical protein